MDIYQQNQKFLKSKSLILKPTCSYVIPYELETDNLFITLSEYNFLYIRNKISNKEITIKLTEVLLTDIILNALN